MLIRKVFVFVYILINCFFSYSRQNEIISKTKQEFLNIERKNDTISKSVFNGSDTLNITILLNLHELLADTSKTSKDFPAILIYDESSTTSDTLLIDIAKRGKFRKKTENCDFPPLSIKFHDDAKGSIFENGEKLKLVTHCNTCNKDFEQYLFQEYLIYKLYNIITDVSYKTKLVNITYRDTLTGEEIHSYAFFIESNESLENRLGGDLIKAKTAPIDKIDKESMAKLIFFQNMIINSDWSVSIMHNIKMISLDPFYAPVPIPYDFDWAGIIDIPYSTYLYTAKDGHTPQRKFKGVCIERKHVKQTVRYFNEKKEEIYDLYTSFKLLDNKQLERILKSYDEFYRTINNSFTLHKELKSLCKK
ncbi:MAG: hypothetical protein JXB49_37620 [Bacteroidales bacterium]|nr:hypothetical protein [Bacteroidales bacterium]